MTMCLKYWKINYNGDKKSCRWIEDGYTVQREGENEVIMTEFRLLHQGPNCFLPFGAPRDKIM